MQKIFQISCFNLAASVNLRISRAPVFRQSFRRRWLEAAQKLGVPNHFENVSELCKQVNMCEINFNIQFQNSSRPRSIYTLFAAKVESLLKSPICVIHFSFLYSVNLDFLNFSTGSGEATKPKIDSIFG